MKLYKFIAAFVAVAMIGGLVTGCMKDDEFLEEHSYAYDDGTFYNYESTLEMGLAACYAEVEYLMMGNSHEKHSWMLQGIGLDTFSSGSGTADFGSWILNADNGYTRHWYDYGFQLINRANTVIDMIDENEDVTYSTATKKNELRAEAVFMRGWAYRVLAAMFGNVPFIEHRTTEANYAYVPNTRQELWEFIQKDFTYAAENLPTTPRLNPGTVTKAAADVMLAEVDLALGDFDGAIAAASKVIAGQDGDYHIMTSRFGSRKDEATDRYGNALNPYWDLFREAWGRDANGNSVKKADVDNAASLENKEAIWICQYNYGTFETGGGGDSWWRVHSSATEASWTPNVLIGAQTLRTKADGKKFYLFTDDGATFPYGAPATSAVASDDYITPISIDATAAGYDETAQTATISEEVAAQYGIKAGKYDLTDSKYPFKYNESANTIEVRRKVANVAQDSVGGRVDRLGRVCYPVDYVWNAGAWTEDGLWSDPNDFRGSEVMIQKNFYLPGGSTWFEARREMYRREAAAKGTADETNYKVNASDTTAIYPRFWKFSDDCHPDFATTSNNKGYDVDWYMIRVPEAYLLRAEAYLAKGNTAQAAADINVVRSRAGASPVSASDVDIDYILDERTREFLGEEHRFVTLNRLSCNDNCGSYVTSKYPTQNATTSNTAYERVHKYGYGFENLAAANQTRETYTKNGKTYHYSAFHPWNYQYPIPKQVIDANSGAAYPQNPGY